MAQGSGGPLAAFDVSPDGSRIVYSSCRYRAHSKPDAGFPTYFNYRPEIVEIHTGGSRGLRRLTTNSDFDNYPSWSPDGRRIAFLTGNVGFPTWEPGRQRGLHTLYTTAADGAADGYGLLPIHDGAGGDSLDLAHQPARWSPDGQRLAFVTKTDNRADDAIYTLMEKAIYAIYTIGADGADRQRLTEAVSGPSWSPDGRRLAYAKVDGDEVALYTSRVDGSDVRRVTTIEGWYRAWHRGDRESGPAGAWIETVAWSPDGSHILYTCGWSVCVVNVDGSVVGRSPSGLAARVAVAAWSPDGSEIAVHRGNTEFPRFRDRISDADVALYTMVPDGTDIEVLAWYDAALGLKTVGAGGQGEAADVAACGAGTAVLEPRANPSLVRDCETLLGLRDALAGAAELDWHPDRPLATWEGVVLGGTPQRVVEVNLPERDLSGEIPPELSGLTHLRVLDLGANRLIGEIPPSLGQLRFLRELDASENNLYGDIPSELGLLTELSHLQLDDNYLSGALPLLLGQLSNLTSLNLRTNQLAGPVPAALGRLANLQQLDLGQNQLTGPIPAAWGQLVNLTALVLHSNQLTGAIPPELGRLVNLRILDVNHNQLTGSIPAEFGELASLSELSLSYNQLTGTVPRALGQIEGLTLWLEGNQLVGCLPSEVAVVNRDRLGLPDCLPRCPPEVVVVKRDRFGLPECLPG